MLAALVVCLWLAAATANSEGVMTRWREGRDLPWQVQPAEAGPRWGVATQVVVPRPLVPGQKREMEFSFGRQGEAVLTPFIVMYEPSTHQLLKAVDFEFEYAERRLLGVRHKATYETVTQDPNRVFFTVSFYWKEHKSMHATDGMTLMKAWLMVLAVALSGIVMLDEYLRSRVFLSSAAVSRHSSNSPLLMKKLRHGAHSPGGSGESSPAVVNSPDTKKRE